LPKDYLDSLKNAIIAFEMEVWQLESVFKLCQNRDEQSYDNINEKLHAQGGDPRTIAEEMRKRKTQVFHKRP
jgi:transcriptional regulator